ncbi:MAG: zinc-ribbon domain-containing protein [Streptosporangiaceae bacterium]|jgi:hypothetical protein
MIFGLRVYFRSIGQGSFHCHRCGGDRQYRLRSGRRWIHVFFIPLIRLGKAGEHVQCTGCQTCYRPEVRALPTSAQMLAALPAGMRAAAAAMLRAGDARSGRARRRAVDSVRAAGLADYDDAALAGDLDQAGRPGFDLAPPMNALALQLVVPAREWFLADVVRIGLAGGMLSAEQRYTAREIAAQLGMTPAQAYGVILMTEESAPAE